MNIHCFFQVGWRRPAEVVLHLCVQGDLGQDAGGVGGAETVVHGGQIPEGEGRHGGVQAVVSPIILQSKAWE